jgi:hypothetical protein
VFFINKAYDAAQVIHQHALPSFFNLHNKQVLLNLNGRSFVGEEPAYRRQAPVKASYKTIIVICFIEVAWPTSLRFSL